MKYLKRFNESGNTSFDWLRKQSNERYIDLMYILQSDIFDDYNIISKTDETFEMDDEEGYPEHKFWVFRFKGSANSNFDNSDPDSIGDSEVDSIIVFNILPNMKDKFTKSLLDLKDKVKDIIGRELIFEEEFYGIPESPEAYDYVIKLGDKPKVLKESSEEVEKFLMLDEDIQWVKDALLELTDMGYNVNIRTHSVYGVSHPGLSITIDGKLLPIDIGEYLLTIHSYLSERGYFGFMPSTTPLPNTVLSAYDYDNEYSQSRHSVRVKASLKGIDNNFERDLPNFVDMLKRFTHKAPFDSVGVSYYKPNKKVNESKHSDVKSDIEDILLELEDYGIEYSTSDVSYYKDGINPYTCIRVGIKDGKDRLFRLDDIMDVLLRLKDYLKGTKYSIDIGIPNSGDYYPIDKFMEEFRGEELYHIYLFIWLSFNLTW